MKLLLLGSTGLVGSHVLQLALSDPAISVVAPVRRELPAHPRLSAPVVDYEHLPENAAWWEADALICTLGTTMKIAGTKAAFQRVDYDYPLTAARLARLHGTPTVVLNSATGANASSAFFYNRVKGELERDLAMLSFPSLNFVRPGLIGGEREQRRFAEQSASRVLNLVAPILPKAWRINPAKNIASALLDCAQRARPGIHVVSSNALV